LGDWGIGGLGLSAFGDLSVSICAAREPRIRVTFGTLLSRRAGAMKQ
jgi:hypothetical protein